MALVRAARSGRLLQQALPPVRTRASQLRRYSMKDWNTESHAELRAGAYTTAFLPGVLSGLVQSSTGMAGGMTMIWSLTTLVRLPAAVATATSLPTQLAGNAVAGSILLCSGCVDLAAVALIAAPGAAFAVVGARCPGPPGSYKRPKRFP